MPITQSAKKALRQAVRRNKQNLAHKDAYKGVIKSIKKLTDAGKIKDAEKLIPQLFKALDKATKKNAIKKNKASRLKSRISKLFRKEAR